MHAWFFLLTPPHHTGVGVAYAWLCWGVLCCAVMCCGVLWFYLRTRAVQAYRCLPAVETHQNMHTHIFKQCAHTGQAHNLNKKVETRGNAERRAGGVGWHASVCEGGACGVKT